MATADTIIVVDDHKDTCEFVKAALEGAGYETRIAGDGAQALALMRERPADLMITDIFMPRQTGFQTVTACKAEFPRTRIIVMSAGTIPGFEYDFLAAAAHLRVGATLRKPFDAEQLLAAVRKLLGPDQQRFEATRA